MDDYEKVVLKRATEIVNAVEWSGDMRVNLTTALGAGRVLLKMLEKTQQEAYLEGFIAGLELYAWWKDGVQYVGTCGTTLKEAVEWAKKEFNQKI